MHRRLICPRSRDESRVGTLVDALEAAVAKCHPSVAPGSPVPEAEGRKLNYFHSQTLPSPSPRTLMRALVKARVSFDWTTVAVAVSLVQRYRRRNGPNSVTPHMLHRLLIAYLLIATKAHQDVFPTNRLIAATIGMPKKELSRMEAHACYDLDWRVQIDHEDLVRDEAELCGCSVHISPTHLASSSALSEDAPLPADHSLDETESPEPIAAA